MTQPPVLCKQTRRRVTYSRSTVRLATATAHLGAETQPSLHHIAALRTSVSNHLAQVDTSVKWTNVTALLSQKDTNQSLALEVLEWKAKYDYLKLRLGIAQSRTEVARAQAQVWKQKFAEANRQMRTCEDCLKPLISIDQLEAECRELE